MGHAKQGGTPQRWGWLTLGRQEGAVRSPGHGEWVKAAPSVAADCRDLVTDPGAVPWGLGTHPLQAAPPCSPCSRHQH